MDTLIHFLHVLSACFWVGGQLFLALVLAPLLRQQMTPSARMPLSLAIARRFKKWGHGALGILLLSGLWQVRYVFMFMGSAGSFLATPYGQVFVLKMGLLALALLLGFFHDKRWGPALAALADRSDSSEYRQALGRMLFWARFNIFVSIAVVACAASLRHISF